MFTVRKMETENMPNLSKLLLLAAAFTTLSVRGMEGDPEALLQRMRELGVSLPEETERLAIAQELVQNPTLSPDEHQEVQQTIAHGQLQRMRDLGQSFSEETERLAIAQELVQNPTLSPDMRQEVQQILDAHP
jgi:hypothetical protein